MVVTAAMRCAATTLRHTRCLKGAVVLAYREVWVQPRIENPTMPVCKVHWDKIRRTLQRPQWWY